MMVITAKRHSLEQPSFQLFQVVSIHFVMRIGNAFCNPPCP